MHVYSVLYDEELIRFPYYSCDDLLMQTPGNGVLRRQREAAAVLSVCAQIQKDCLPWLLSHSQKLLGF